MAESKRLNVLYQSSDYYAFPTCVSIASLCENNQGLESIRIFLLNDGISDKNLQHMREVVSEFGRTLEVVDAREFNSQILESGLKPYRGSTSTYLKLYSFDNLPVDDEPVLYLDGDTIVDKPLDDLLQIREESPSCILACKELFSNSHRLRIGLRQNEPYYNAGVLFIDVGTWKKEGLLAQASHALRENGGNYVFAEQDMLSTALNEKIDSISPSFNFLPSFELYGYKGCLNIYELSSDNFYPESEIESITKNGAHIYHSVGGMIGRPWEKGNRHPHNDLFDKYMQISHYDSTEKYESKFTAMQNAQYVLHGVLPSFIYEPIHRTMLNKYLNDCHKGIRDY